MKLAPKTWILIGIVAVVIIAVIAVIMNQAAPSANSLTATGAKYNQYTAEACARGALGKVFCESNGYAWNSPSPLPSLPTADQAYQNCLSGNPSHPELCDSLKPTASPSVMPSAVTPTTTPSTAVTTTPTPPPTTTPTTPPSPTATPADYEAYHDCLANNASNPENCDALNPSGTSSTTTTGATTTTTSNTTDEDAGEDLNFVEWIIQTIKGWFS